MADLQNLQISDTYDGLIKTSDENAIDGNLKTLQDGSGNDLPMQVSTSTVNFTGAVTGDNNTTYTLDTAQAGSDATITLTGSDASTDSITLAAGSNITLTEAGDTITIASTGGGGGGGITAYSIQSTTVTGPSGADAIGAWVRIPGGTFANGDLLKIDGIIEKNNVAGWQYLNIRISPNNTGVFDGVQIGTNQSPATAPTLSVLVNKRLAISTADSRTKGQNDNSFWDEQGNFNVINGDINWAVDQYLTFVYYIDDAASSCTVHNLTIAKVNG